MKTDNQKQSIRFLEDMLTQLESSGDLSIENNPSGLMALLYLERVADFSRGYPDTSVMSGRAKNKREKNYQKLESLRTRIAELGERLPVEKRKQILEDFNVTTTVTSMLNGGNPAANEPVDNRSSKDFVDEWIGKDQK